MINNISRAALKAGKAIGKFAMEHREEAAEIGKKILSAAALVILDSMRKKIDGKDTKSKN